MAITSTEQTSILNLVVSMFNAAPGATNLTSIAASFEANGRSLTTLANNLAMSSAFTDQFAGLVTDAAVANKMAANFGLTSGTAYTNAYNYFVAELAAGKTKATIMKAANDYLIGTHDAMFNDAAATLVNKTTVAYDYSVTKQLSGATFAALQTAVSGVDATAASVTAKIASASTGTTFTLTTAADPLTGTANNDTFTAIIDQATPANSTITAADTISGGAGTDTLNVTGTGTTLDVLGAALVTGIETVNIRATTANSLDASQIAGLTAVNANLGAGTVLVTNLAAGASIGVVGNGTVINGEVAFAHATATSAVTLNISGGTAMTAGITAKAALGGTATGTATTATINSTGAANTVGTVDLANATLTSVTINAATNLSGDMLSQATDQVAATGAVTVSGAATLVTFTAALDNDIATLNASGLTAGGISATLGSLVTQTVTGGAGADTITTNVTLTTGSVNAGAGTDTLVVTAGGTQLNTAALGAKYTNFETLRVNDDQSMSVISGITAVELNAMTAKAVTNMTATQAANVKVLGDQTTGVTLALAAATGTSDVLTITAGTGLLATAAFDLNALTVTGFETLNVNANAGATATAADKTVVIASLTGATLNTVNLTGTAFSITNAATAVASTINASALTGDGATTTLGLTIGSTSFVAGSTVTGSNYVDNITLANEGSTLNLGAGNDLVTTTVAILVADGTTDGTINGGTGTADTLTVSDAAATLTDNHFTKVSNMDKLTLNATGATSITAGAAFNAAFASGVTITQASKADASATTYALGLSTVNTTIVLTTAENGSDATATNITTGSGTDTVTVAAASYLGFAGALTNSISTGAGDDTIVFSTGTLANLNATGRAMTITAGTGADTITESSVNGEDAEMNTMYVVAAGDSLTTAWDKITGATASNGTFFSDGIDFTGTAAIGTLATSTDSGTILTHSITAGVALFDDAAVYATALVINSANLADVVGYLAANTATNDVVAFAYDTDNNGANDATMVFHNGTTDSLVQLTGVTGVDALITTNVAGANDLFIQ